MKLFPFPFSVSPKNSHSVGKPLNISGHCSFSGPLLQWSTGNGEHSPGHSLPGMGLVMWWGSCASSHQLPPSSQGWKWRSFLLVVPPGGMKAAGNDCAPLLLSTSFLEPDMFRSALGSCWLDQSHAELTALASPLEFVQDKHWSGTPTLPTLNFAKAAISPEVFIQIFSWTPPSSCWSRLWRNKHSGADTFHEETRPCLS